MKRKLLLLTVFTFGLKILVNAQGVWENQNPAKFIYNFERTLANPGDGLPTFTSTASVAQSISKSGGPVGFLPFPTSGYAKINFPASSTASATFDGTGANTKLIYKIAATNGSAAPYTGYSKVAWYENTETSAVTSFFFTLKPNATTASGRFFLVFGNTPTATPDGNNIYSGADFLEYWTNGQSVFGGLKFDIYGGDYPGWGYRKSGNSDYGFQEVVFDPSFGAETGTPLTKNIENAFEIYCNNFSTPVNYVRSSTTYTVAVGAYHIWVNGSQKALINGGVPNYNFPAASGENTTNAAINSIGLFGDQNSGDLNITVSNIEMAYVAAGTLPVTFNAFSGEKQSKGIRLNFATSSEQNNSHFEVLRSSNRTDFENIGKVEAKGTASQYSFYDAEPYAGYNYYQLKQVDKDGKSNLFDKIVAVNTGFEKGDISIVSLANNQLTYSLSAIKSSNAVLKITDINGRTVANNKVALQKGTNLNSISLPQANGAYVLTIFSDDVVKSVKFIK